MDEPLSELDKVLNLAYVRKHSKIKLLLNKIVREEINLIDHVNVQATEENAPMNEEIDKIITKADNILTSGIKTNQNANSEKLQEYFILMKLKSSPLYNLLEELTR